MQNHDDRNPEVAVEFADHFDDFKLTADVEKGGRFVEQEQFRLLGESHGDPCALPFPAGERRDGAFAERLHACHAECAGDGLAVLRSGEVSRAAVRKASAGDELFHGQFARSVMKLGKNRHSARELSGVVFGNGASVEQDFPRARREDASDVFEQSRFSASVRAEQSDDSVRGNFHVDVVQNEFCAVSGAEGAYFNFHSGAS